MAAAATGAVKINADGVVHAASRLGGIGFMARNHAGSFLACKLVVLNGISNSVHAKLLAHVRRAANGHLVKASGFPSGCSAS
ncbi:hypothetical protein ACE6H2_010619 [Prunus campanulata]